MLSVLFENDDLLIIDKPAGLAVQPGAGVTTCLLDVAEREFGFKPYLVHRLDRETAGCIAIARSPRAASEFGESFASRGCEKRYRALVAGEPTSDAFELHEDVIVRGERKSAHTSALTLARFGEFSQLELVLGTGRNHQIRIHLAGAGFPIVGDDRHGDFALNKRVARAYGARKLMLYSCSLTLPGGISARAPAPPHYASFLEALAAGAVR
ncbi:MAG: RluA family pseudouridine synthase [Spirochaetes bacterium]|nr:RluA family pseudouridine synthase [Spirochaetota bacterium]